MTGTARAVRMASQGGPAVMRVETAELPAPGPGEVLLRQTAIGLNYIDVYFRSGTYPLPPGSGVGAEAAGIVEAVGDGVSDLEPGDRVCYAGSAPGAYADRRIMPAARLVPIPDGVSDEDAAALAMKGMTVEYLVTRCVELKPGQTALMYAAAGGVGLIAGQWGRSIGARMIGVAAGPEKVELARRHGYDVVIDRTTEDVPRRIKDETGGAGVSVVYDSVGRATFEDSLAALAPRGLFVTFGATTGAPPPLEAERLQKGGSLYYTRPTLATYIASREDLVASAAKLFALVASGAIRSHVGHRYRLDEIVQAHEDLEAGRTIGQSLIMP